MAEFDMEDPKVRPWAVASFRSTVSNLEAAIAASEDEASKRAAITGAYAGVLAVMWKHRPKGMTEREVEYAAVRAIANYMPSLAKGLEP